jgi:DNA-binding NtrC family response regulator
MVLFSRGEEIGLEDLPAEYRAQTTAPEIVAQSTVWVPRSMADVERELILRTVDHTGGHRARAAELLGIGLRTLQRKLKEYGEISPRDPDEP